MEASNMLISNPYVNTCKLENRYFRSSIFFLFLISFRFQTYQWLQDDKGNFLKINFAGKHFFKVDQQMKKPPIWAKMVHKWQFVTFAIRAVEASDKNDCELHKILRNFYRGHFWKILIVLVIFELRFVLWCVYFYQYFTDVHSLYKAQKMSSNDISCSHSYATVGSRDADDGCCYVKLSQLVTQSIKEII